MTLGLSATAAPFLSRAKLTDGPKGSPLVRLEGLKDAKAMLLGRGLVSLGVERLVVQVDVLEVVEAIVGGLDMEIWSSALLFGRHVEAFPVR